MKVKVFLMTCLTGLSVVSISCDDDTSVIAPVFSPVTLKYGQSAIIQSENVELKFDSIIHDSRCPPNAYCIWGGMAEIRLRLIKLPVDTHFVTLPILLGVHKNDSDSHIPIDTLGFHITLLQLDPYPAPTNDSDYVATVLIWSPQSSDSLEGEVILSNMEPSTIMIERFQVDSVWIRDDVIWLRVTYGGGCQNHHFWLFMSPDNFMESNPVQVAFFLRHYSNNDPCDALITRDLAFSLRPMIIRHRQVYHRDDDILVNMFHFADSVGGEMTRVLYQPPGS